MFCKHCGKEIPDEAVICVHCGAMTDAPTAVNAQPAVSGKTSNGFAIAGFVLSLVSIFSSTYTYGILAILGLVFSIIGFVKSKTCGKGKGFAIAGISISSASLFISVLIIILSVSLSLALPAIGSCVGTEY